MKYAPIQSATLDFTKEGTPVSREFNDVYFSDNQGPEETRYVFVAGNRFPERFLTHSRALLIVGETGFGSGLNFLTLWQTLEQFWQTHPHTPLSRLHFISFEKFPLTATDLQIAQQHWPELAPFAVELQKNWPVPFSGCHRLLLAQGRITLDLWLGDINQLIPQLDDTLNNQVDAWFLDGFSPAKNPDMWTGQVFNALAKWTRAGGTLATFTSAGFVRRGLSEAGFSVTKSKGFGPKREMLTGVMEKAIESTPRTPWYARPKVQGDNELAIVGGGIASALLAMAMLRRGWQVTLYCTQDAPARGASGNQQAALYPLLNPHDAALAHFFPAAFTFARRLYDSLPVDFEHDWCGVVQLGWDTKSQTKIAKMLDMGLPESLVYPLNQQQVAAECGLETRCAGVRYPLGGWLCPAQLTRGIIALAEKQGLTTCYRHEVAAMEHAGQGWQLSFARQPPKHHCAVVLANGYKINTFSQTSQLPVYSVKGQVSHIPASPELSQLRQVLCYDGYLTPQHLAHQQHCIGASYQRGIEDTGYSEADQLHNRQRLIDCLPDVPWPKNVDVSDRLARCSVRSAVRDHLPMVGSVPHYAATLQNFSSLENSSTEVGSSVYPNLFMLGALGSRGFCSAPLAAEILAAQMSGEPIPLGQETLAAVNPNRLWIRKLSKIKLS